MAKPFDEYVREIVDEFLQTVVVVDDEALSSGDSAHDDSDSEDSPEEERPAPGGKDIGRLTSPTGKSADGHELPAREVIDAFALKGLICSILDPDDAVEERLKRATARADLLVMDWWIHHDRGGRAVELIEAVLVEDERLESRRLRVIAIYTGQDDLGSVADDLAGMSEKFYKDFELERDDGSLTMTKGPIRLTVLAKEHVKMAAGDRANKVKIADLPDRLAKEFTQLTQGLVSAVALKAFAALRRDTHRVLEKLGPKLDRGYLGHRVAQRRPADAETHLTNLVAAEFQSVLADAQVGSSADLEAIKMWLRWAGKVGLKPGGLFNLDPKITRQQVAKMVSEGLGDEEIFKAHLKGVDHRKKGDLKKVLGDATGLFCIKDDEPNTANGMFAARMVLRTTYRKPRRELRLGTIVYRNKKFLMCVQPVCDSVRLDPETPVSFPFLALEPSAAGETDVVVPHPIHEDEWVSLKLARKPRSLTMIAFKANANGVVGVYRTGREYRFRSMDGRYRWVADLKPEFAHRVANELGHQFSRIGLAEPELLRLSRSS